jgi:hypothetical protein
MRSWILRVLGAHEMRRRRLTGSSKTARISSRTEPSQRCLRVRTIQEEADWNHGPDEPKLPKKPHETCTNHPSPTGPTTRPPKSTPSRAARHCTWSSPSAVAAREQRPQQRRSERVTNSNGQKRAQARVEAICEKSRVENKRTLGILRAKGWQREDDHGVGQHWTALPCSSQECRYVAPAALV